MKRLLSFFCVLLASMSVQAGWELDKQQSRLHFLSSKKVHINEIHRFTEFNGRISDKGQLKVEVELASVETLIPIRNQRMQEKLFEITNFPQATLEAQLSDAVMQRQVGESQFVSLKANISLHGVTQTQVIDLHVSRIAKDRIIANTVKPVLIDARQYKLKAGVDMLKTLAGLDAISYVVPVSFTVIFKQ